LLLVANALLFAARTPAQDDVTSLYKARCVAYHGADGKGDTPAAKSLGARDFASPEVSKETDEQLINITANGKNKMPGYATSLKDSQIKDLVAYIRELTRKKK
jgi:mono/diheme cytochrome c family protein